MEAEKGEQLKNKSVFFEPREPGESTTGNEKLWLLSTNQICVFVFVYFLSIILEKAQAKKGRAKYHFFAWLLARWQEGFVCDEFNVNVQY